MPKTGTQTSWQYVLEDSKESPTTSTSPFKLPGIVTSAPNDTKFNAKTYRGMKPTGSTDQRAPDLITASKNEYGFSMTYIPLKRLSSPKYDFRHFHNCVLNNSSSTTLNGAWTYGTSTTSNLRTFTLFKEIDNLQLQMKGCKITRLTGRCSLDSPVEITVEGIASASTYADLSRTDATTLRDGTPFMWSDIQIYLDGALATFCTAYEYTIDNSGKSEHTFR